MNIEPNWTVYLSALLMLVNLVKRLLKAETSLNHEFPDYCYTRQNWLEDGLAGSK